MTTVVCLFVRGHVPFTAEYVVRLAAMVRRQIDRPHRFVCLTDRPEQMPPGIEAIRVEPFRGLKAWWNKVRLFDASLGLRGRLLYLDLDTLVVAGLGPILDFPAPFALVPHAGTFEGKGPLKVVKRFNSSVMVWDAGHCDDIFQAWSPKVGERLFGDQDFIGEVRPGAAQMPLSWFPRISEIGDTGLPDIAKVVLVKKPKNDIAAARWPWVNDVWRAAS